MESAAEERHLDVCMGCGQMFVRETIQLCPNCATNEMHRFALVREYLRANGRRSITEVADATGLPRTEVGTYIMQGRLIEVDPETGRPRAESLLPQHELDEQLQSEAERNQARRRGRLPSSDEPAADPEGDDRVRYVRRSRREGDD